MAYCTVADLKSHGLNPEAFASKSATQKREAITSWANYMDGYLGSRYTLPILTPFPPVLVECNAALAACALIDSNGRDPDADKGVDTLKKFWVDWLHEVQDKETTPPGIIDSSPGATPGGSTSTGRRLITSSSRGYSVRGTGNPRGGFQSD